MKRKEVRFLYRFFIVFSLIIPLSISLVSNEKAANEKSNEEIYTQRMEMYNLYNHFYVPWYYIAAVDQYERNIQEVRSDIPKRKGIIAIQFSNDFWVGELNPNKEDTFPISIQYFGGMGKDGNGDGSVDLEQDEDVLLSMISYLSTFGMTKKDFELALWTYYKSEETVRQIMTISALYEHFQTIALDQHYFPLPISSHYSYKGTWGGNRGWGGKRIHEGTDLFAHYGIEVYSTSYGVVESMGWNDYGGWRIGIRDNHNTYHYYAHLNSYQQKLKVGDIVTPGTLIGFVGSSGYGKEGTSGKFPPHLHYGMYKFNGRTEWAFDPYPYLKIWEKQTKSKKQ